MPSRLANVLTHLPALALAVGLAAPRPAAATETAAKFAILLDYDTGAVLLEKNADEPMAPASMSKLMTLYMVFERLEAGSLRLEDTFPVSEKAWRMGGSKMFVGINTRVKLEDLLRGIVVQSGNDACIVVAEGLARSEAEFSEDMTKRAREIGLADSTFVNSTGWPHPDHVMTARDIAKLSAAIIEEFPEYYPLFAEKTYTYNDIKQGNRNPLLYGYDGADGLKTGYTKASGYGLAVSVKRKDRRLILVFSGLASKKRRAREAVRLLDWAFREFDNFKLFGAGETVDNAAVWLGEETEVPLVVQDEVTLTLPLEARRGMKVKVAYDGPVAAPVRAGDPLATLAVSTPGAETLEIPLVAGKDIARLGVFGRLAAALKYLAWGAAE